MVVTTSGNGDNHSREVSESAIENGRPEKPAVFLKCGGGGET